MARMPRVYVAGPFRAKNAWEVHQNVEHAEAWGQALRVLGCNPLVPHAIGRVFDGTLTSEYWIRATLDWMRLCDAMILLAGWEQSQGSRGEREEAARLGMRVLDVGPLSAYQGEMLSTFAAELHEAVKTFPETGTTPLWVLERGPVC